MICCVIAKGRKGGDVMIKKRPLLVAASVFCLTATIFIVSSTGYDPWIDYDEDGTVDYDDFISLAGEYGTSGDPTKNVSVTNWPVERQLFPENLILIGAYANRRILVDETTYHPPSSWPAALPGGDLLGGTLNSTYQLYYNQTFVHQKISLDAYEIYGTPTVTVTFDLATLNNSFFRFDFNAYLGMVSLEGSWVEIAHLGNVSSWYGGVINPSETFTVTISHDPYPPLRFGIEPDWRLAVRLTIHGEKLVGYPDADFSMTLLYRRNEYDFVVDIPIIKNP